jgi:hypothetical protein
MGPSPRPSGTAVRIGQQAHLREVTVGVHDASHRPPERDHAQVRLHTVLGATIDHDHARLPREAVRDDRGADRSRRQLLLHPEESSQSLVLERALAVPPDLLP